MHTHMYIINVCVNTHTHTLTFTCDQTFLAWAWQPVLHPEQKWGLPGSKPQQKGNGMGTLTEPGNALLINKKGSHP